MPSSASLAVRHHSRDHAVGEADGNATTRDDVTRLTAVPGATHTCVDDGNLTSDGVRSYTYDRANRLKEVTEEWFPNVHGY